MKLFVQRAVNTHIRYSYWVHRICDEFHGRNNSEREGIEKRVRIGALAGKAHKQGLLCQRDWPKCQHRKRGICRESSWKTYLSKRKKLQRIFQEKRKKWFTYSCLVPLWTASSYLICEKEQSNPDSQLCLWTHTIFILCHMWPTIRISNRKQIHYTGTPLACSFYCIRLLGFCNFFPFCWVSCLGDLVWGLLFLCTHIYKWDPFT